MIKKLSNTAEREIIEQQFRRTYKFPKVYQPNLVINGSEESLVSVITTEDPTFINYSIWGMLPLHYKDEWLDFQNVFETLTIDKEHLLSIPQYKEALATRRCLIIITGFFSYHLKDGMLYPFHVYLKKNQPFCVAGIYTMLEDGFITCSLLTRKASGVLQRIQNITNLEPILISKKDINFWLNPDKELVDISSFLEKEPNSLLKADPIAKELFNKNISFDSLLEPIHYNGLSDLLNNQ